MRISLNRLAVYLGIIFVIVYSWSGYFAWSRGIDVFAVYMRLSLFIPLIFVTLIVLGWYHRQQNAEPYLSFKQGLQFAFIAYMIFEVGMLVFNITLYNFVDKTLYFKLEEYNLLQTQAGLVKMHIEDKSVADALDKVRKDPIKDLTVMQILIGVGQDVIWYFLKSMGVGIILQRKPPAGVAFTQAPDPA
jgi:hypothetical protein